MEAEPRAARPSLRGPEGSSTRRAPNQTLDGETWQAPCASAWSARANGNTAPTDKASLQPLPKTHGALARSIRASAWRVSRFARAAANVRTENAQGHRLHGRWPN